MSNSHHVHGESDSLAPLTTDQSHEQDNSRSLPPSTRSTPSPTFAPAPEQKQRYDDPDLSDSSIAMKDLNSVNAYTTEAVEAVERGQTVTVPKGERGLRFWLCIIAIMVSSFLMVLDLVSWFVS